MLFAASTSSTSLTRADTELKVDFDGEPEDAGPASSAVTGKPSPARKALSPRTKKPATNATATTMTRPSARARCRLRSSSLRAFATVFLSPCFMRRRVRPPRYTFR